MIGLPSRPLNLLPPSHLVCTSPIDHPDWNYRPVFSRIQRLRFRIILDLLGETRFDNLLEVGYGSGIFMPTLAERCTSLYGVDPHPMSREVQAKLDGYGVKAALAPGSATALPYESGFFDCVVAVSCLEYILDIEAAAREIHRVLAPGGTFAFCTPGATPLWNLALRVATREGPAQYGDRREKLQPTLRGHFRVVREICLPPLGGPAIRLYTGLRMEKD